MIYVVFWIVGSLLILLGAKLDIVGLKNTARTETSFFWGLVTSWPILFAWFILGGLWLAIWYCVKMPFKWFWKWLIKPKREV